MKRRLIWRTTKRFRERMTSLALHKRRIGSFEDGKQICIHRLYFLCLLVLQLFCSEDVGNQENASLYSSTLRTGLPFYFAARVIISCIKANACSSIPNRALLCLFPPPWTRTTAMILPLLPSLISRCPSPFECKSRLVSCISNSAW